MIFPRLTRFWHLRAQRWLDALSAERVSWFGTGLAVAAAGFVAYLLVVEPLVSAQAAPPPPRPAPPPLRVQVVGEVAQPGNYDVPHTARVEDAVRLAGGLTEHADVAYLNLAARVIDGQRIVVGRLRAPETPRPYASRSPPERTRTAATSSTWTAPTDATVTRGGAAGNEPGATADGAAPTDQPSAHAAATTDAHRPSADAHAASANGGAPGASSQNGASRVATPGPASGAGAGAEALATAQSRAAERATAAPRPARTATRTAQRTRTPTVQRTRTPTVQRTRAPAEERTSAPDSAAATTGPSEAGTASVPAAARATTTRGPRSTWPAARRIPQPATETPTVAPVEHG